MKPQANPDEVSRIQRANTALIRYPRFKELHETIKLCQTLSRTAGEPHCMLLDGVTGAGKTTLVRSWSDDVAFQRVETLHGSIIPVLYVETPSPATIKSVSAAMLRQLGHPRATSGTLWSMNERLVHFLRECKVEVGVMDDFHHLHEEVTRHALLTVSNWLKVLIKETGVPFLVVGLEEKVRLILRANPQLSRLFAVRETLQPFAWDPANPQTIKDFARFIEYAEKASGMPLTAEIPRTEMLLRLHYATNGVVGNLMNLMRQARVLAAWCNKEALDPVVLSLAFRQRLIEHLPGKVDPFAGVGEVEFVLPAAQPTQATQPSKRRRHANPPVTEVLSRQ